MKKKLLTCESGCRIKLKRPHPNPSPKEKGKKAFKFHKALIVSTGKSPLPGELVPILREHLGEVYF
jgi:hypothetical protein